MITIRLQRRGRKNDPSFRVIVVDSTKKPKTGNYLEMVGSYDPRIDRIELKDERIKEWMKNGATVSDTVHNLLVTKKVITGKKINVLPKKVAPVQEAPAEAAPAPTSEKVGVPTESIVIEAAAETEVQGENSVATEEAAE